jgi:DNA-binding NtrC family response regulator
LTALQRYRWPGNVRELQNVIERAVLLGKESVIGVADLPSTIASVGSVSLDASAGLTLKQSMESPERQIIREVLEANHWNRNVTAQILGINRTTLYKKMKRLGLEDLALSMGR